MRLGRRATRNVPRPLEALAFRPRLDLALSVNRVDGALRLKKIPIAVDVTPLRIVATGGSGLFRSPRAAARPPKPSRPYLNDYRKRAVEGKGVPDSEDLGVRVTIKQK